MKKVLIYSLIIVLVLSLTGCGAKEKLEKKVGEAITEKIIEDVSGGKVDIKDDKITFQGEDGGKLTMGGTEWPSSDLVKYIPKFEEGSVVSVMETQDALMITLEDVKQEDLMGYLEKIKKDYTEEAFEVNSEGSVSYGANNGNGVGVQIFFGDESLSITVAREEQ